MHRHSYIYTHEQIHRHTNTHYSYTLDNCPYEHTSSSSFTLHFPLSRRDWTSCNLPSSAANSRSLSSEALAAACVISSSHSRKRMADTWLKWGWGQVHTYIKEPYYYGKKSSHRRLYYTTCVLGVRQEQMSANKEGEQVLSAGMWAHWAAFCWTL